jgi:hypothetical protein
VAEPAVDLIEKFWAVSLTMLLANGYHAIMNPSIPEAQIKLNQPQGANGVTVVVSPRAR